MPFVDMNVKLGLILREGQTEGAGEEGVVLRYLSELKNRDVTGDWRNCTLKTLGFVLLS